MYKHLFKKQVFFQALMATNTEIKKNLKEGTVNSSELLLTLFQSTAH
jgi:hypothetical protein